MKYNSTDEEERNEVKNTIQQTVSHFTSNTNKVKSSLRNHLQYGLSDFW